MLLFVKRRFILAFYFISSRDQRYDFYFICLDFTSNKSIISSLVKGRTERFTAKNNNKHDRGWSNESIESTDKSWKIAPICNHYHNVCKPNIAKYRYNTVSQTQKDIRYATLCMRPFHTSITEFPHFVQIFWHFVWQNV